MSKLEGWSPAASPSVPARDPPGSVPHHKHHPEIEARAEEIEKEHRAEVHAHTRHWDERSSYGTGKSSPEDSSQGNSGPGQSDRHGGEEQK